MGEGVQTSASHRLRTQINFGYSLTGCRTHMKYWVWKNFERYKVRDRGRHIAIFLALTTPYLCLSFLDL